MSGTCEACSLLILPRAATAQWSLAFSRQPFHLNWKFRDGRVVLSLNFNPVTDPGLKFMSDASSPSLNQQFSTSLKSPDCCFTQTPAVTGWERGKSNSEHGSATTAQAQQSLDCCQHIVWTGSRVLPLWMQHFLKEKSFSLKSTLAQKV